MGHSTTQAARLTSIVMQTGLHGGRVIPFLLVGPPGIGKTMAAHALSSAIETRTGKPFPAEIWSAPQIQPEDAAGLPVPDLEAGHTRLLPLRLGSTVIPHKRGLLALDEFGSITPSQEAAFLNLLQGGRLGELVLPSTIALGAMMNPEDHAAAGRALSAPAANRFIWINWELDSDTWIDYMKGGKGLSAQVDILPEDWEQRFGTTARLLVAEYIKKNPGALMQMPPAHDAGRAWPSPRSWENAARIMAAVMSVGELKESPLAAMGIEGCIGQGPTESFVQWLIDIKLPDPEECLKDPEKSLVGLLKLRGDIAHIALEAIAQASLANRKDSLDRYSRAWDIIGPFFDKKPDQSMGAAIVLAQAKNKFPDYNVKAEYIKSIRPTLEKAGLKTPG